MGKEADNFWNRGAKLYNTIFQRSSSLPARNHKDENLCSERNDRSNRPKKSASTLTLDKTINRQNSLSPYTQTDMPDTFKEARAQAKLERTKTMAPLPRRKDSDKGIMWKLIHNDFGKSSKPSTNPKQTPYSSLFKHFASVKLDGSKGCKDKWTKYFEHGGGMVTTLEADDEHKVDLSQLFLGLRFAHGTHSKLYHGVYKDEAVAVKIITIPDDDDEVKTLEARLKKQFICEVNLLCRLQHENVIKFVAACSKPPVYCIVTEYLAEGSLRSYLHKNEEKTLPLKNVVTYALEIARAMEYVHSQGVIHRDLKPENILISGGLHLKIADFGVACDGSDCDPFDDDPGTYRWMAPEMIKHKCYGRKVDVYSFGIILWELVSGRLPYGDMNPIQAAYAVVNKKVRPPLPEDCPTVMGALIEQCWHSQPEKRPEFSQIVKVLEQFESSIAVNGNLEFVQSINFQDHKKGFVHWIQKHSPPRSKSAMKPKFI
ncbi:hypothetical protein V2J09_019517 [Rumex salicifolius]